MEGLVVAHFDCLLLLLFEVIQDLLEGGCQPCVLVDQLVNVPQALRVCLVLNVVVEELLRFFSELLGEDVIQHHLSSHFPLQRGGLFVLENILWTLFPQEHEGFNLLLFRLFRLLVLLLLELMFKAEPPINELVERAEIRLEILVNVGIL